MKHKIISYGRLILNNELISGSAYIFVGFFASSFLSFLLNLFLVRNFSAHEYGIYASLLSLFVLLGIPSQSLTTIIVRFATDYFAQEKLSEAKAFYLKVLLLSIIIFAILFTFFVIFSPFLKLFLHLENQWYILITGFIVSFGYISIVNFAFLQSLTRFRFISLSSALGGLIKVLFGIILVTLGLKVFGALWAIFLSILIPFVFTFFPLRFLITHKGKMNVRFPMRDVLRYALPTSISILALNSLVSTDVVLVKHFFNSYEAGLYGGLSLVGKTIFYLTGPITSVMFPLLIKRHNLGQNFNRLFYLAMLLVSFPSFCIIVFFSIFPLFSINFFLGGEEYVSVAPYLGLYGLFIGVFSLLNVFVNFFLSLKKTIVFLITAFGAVAQCVLIFYLHDSFYQVIGVSIFSSLCVLFLLLIFYVKEFLNFEKLKNAIGVVNNPRN